MDRTQSVFASPRPPHQIRAVLGFDPTNQVLLEIMVDPQSCQVAEGEYFTEASMAFLDGDTNFAVDLANRYWRGAQNLKFYLSKNHDGGDADHNDFNFPEVLIPFDVSPGRIKIVDGYVPPEKE